MALILNIWIRNRKQEIAILVALGNSKKNIFGQFLCEVLGIAIPTFALVAVVTTTMRKTLNNIIIQLIGEKRYFVCVANEFLSNIIHVYCRNFDYSACSIHCGIFHFKAKTARVVVQSRLMVIEMRKRYGIIRNKKS